MSYFLKIRCDFIYILLPNVKNCDGKDTFEFHKGCRRSRYNFNVDVFMLETMMMVVMVMVIVIVIVEEVEVLLLALLILLLLVFYKMLLFYM